MPDSITKCKFLGFDLDSPLWVASQAPMNPHTRSQHIQLFRKYIKEGASLIKTQFITNVKSRTNGNKNGVRTVFAENGSSPLGFFNLGSIEDNMSYLDEGRSLICGLKQLEVPIVANIAVQHRNFNNPDLWSELAYDVVKAGANIIELNLSCPNNRAKMRVPGQNLPLTINIIKSVKRRLNSLNIPVIVKFTPELNMTKLEEFTKDVIEAGVDGITVVNAPLAMAPPDIYNHGKPKFPGANKSSYTAIHGPVNLYLAYKFVTRIYQTMKSIGKEIELTATGGISKREQVVELIMLGASTVELSSGILLQGYEFISSCKHFLESFMQDEGYRSIDKMRGLAVKYIGEYDEIKFKKMTAVIDYDKCTNCKLCTKTLCMAWKESGNRVIVDKKYCAGCGFCRRICPVGARKLVMS